MYSYFVRLLAVAGSYIYGPDDSRPFSLRNKLDNWDSLEQILRRWSIGYTGAYKKLVPERCNIGWFKIKWCTSEINSVYQRCKRFRHQIACAGLIKVKAVTRNIVCHTRWKRTITKLYRVINMIQIKMCTIEKYHVRAKSRWKIFLILFST